MPKYSYTVINNENKQLSGTINAPDESNARKELNDLGFSIVSLQVVKDDFASSSSAGNTTESTAETENKINAVKFEFSAIDKNGKKILGTIQAQNKYEAYKRLVNEYLFRVETLIEFNLSEDQKAQMLLRGIDDLRDRMEEEQMQKNQKSNNEIDQMQFAEKQVRLKTQVDFVLKKVNEIIETYRNEIQPATREKIRYYLEKLLRIKNSTNLDYIRETCEEMLNYLQHEEIFLHEEQRLKEKTHLAVEAKSLMLRIHNTSKKEVESLSEKLLKWREENIIGNQNPSLVEKFLNFLASFIIGFEEDPADIKELKLKIKDVDRQLKEFVNLYLHAPNTDFKIETKNALKRFWNERKKLMKDLKKLKEHYRDLKRNSSELTMKEKLEVEIHTLSGIILFFYIVYYFVSIYVNTKDISLSINENIGLIFHSTLLKYFFTILFIFHALLGLKIHFFHRNRIFAISIIPLFLFLSLLVILNF